jgi:two-component system, chemotaxis family, chemotaxis protein CheY
MSKHEIPRILIVDDDNFMRKTVRMMLRTLGMHEYDEANSGAGALAAVREFRPNLVICDIGMTPMSGLEFVEKLRNHPDTTLCDTRVIMLTADAKKATILSAAQLRVDGYLVKPVSLKHLGDHLRTSLGMPHSAHTGT